MGILDDAIREHLELKRAHGAAEEDLARQEAEALGPARREPPPAAGLQPEESALVSPPPDPDAAVLPGEGAPPPPSPEDIGAAPELIDAPPPGEPTILPPEPLLEPEYVEPAAPAEVEPEPEAFEAPPAAAPDTPLADALPGEPPLPLQSDQGVPAGDPEPVEEVGPASSSLPAEPEPEPEVAPPPLVQQPTEEFDPLSIEDDEDDHLALPREPAAEALPEPDSFQDETTRVRQVPVPLEDDDSLPPEPVLPAEPAPAPADGEQDVLEETPDFLQDAPEHDRLWFEQKPPRDFDFDD